MGSVLPPQLCCIGVAPDPGGVPYRHGRLLTGRSRWHSHSPVPGRVAVTTGLVSATTTPMLLRLLAQGRLTLEKFVSDHFTFEAIIDAYATFGRAAETKALKVAITR